jgi:hypothetical protein
MRIGIDFDNTIVSYDALFHRIALEQGAIPEETPVSKLAVRDYLRSIGKEDVWTEMQGYVYGARMDEAEAYPGVLAFLRWARGSCIDISIVSHKTRYPFVGEKYDLHQAAGNWIKNHLVDGARPLVATGHIHFELTKDDKLRRIKAECCEWFIDDLPEILQAPTFPVAARPILFDPDGHHAGKTELSTMTGWCEIRNHFAELCSPSR